MAGEDNQAPTSQQVQLSSFLDDSIVRSDRCDARDLRESAVHRDANQATDASVSARLRPMPVLAPVTRIDL